MVEALGSVAAQLPSLVSSVRQVDRRLRLRGWEVLVEVLGR